MTRRTPSGRRSVSAHGAAAAVLVMAALAVTACSGGSEESDGGPTPTTGPTTSATATTEGAPDSAVASCAQPGLPTTVAYRTADGVPTNQLSLDIHAPVAACDASVVMWVHGGGFVRGDKANQVADKVRLFNGRGWILVSVNYRLTAPGDPVAPGMRDQFADVAAAVAWVQANIGAYGGDPSRIALLGHSAGADIVSNLATNPTYLEGAGLGLDALRCAGPLDTEGFDKPSSPGMSATRLVRPGIGIPPTIGVIRGTPRRQGVETQFLDALDAAGVPTTRIDARSLTHEDVNRRIGADGDTVMTPPLVTFLDGCLAAADPAG
jgi:arylformamidase